MLLPLKNISHRRSLTLLTQKFNFVLYGYAPRWTKPYRLNKQKNSLPKRPLQFEIDTSLFKFKCVLDPTACGLCAQFSNMHMF